MTSLWNTQTVLGAQAAHTGAVTDLLGTRSTPKEPAGRTREPQLSHDPEDEVARLDVVAVIC